MQHCHAFDDSEENRLEWHDLHVQFQQQLEAVLEGQLARLGVAVDDFVALLQQQVCARTRVLSAQPYQGRTLRSRVRASVD